MTGTRRSTTLLLAALALSACNCGAPSTAPESPANTPSEGATEASSESEATARNSIEANANRTAREVAQQEIAEAVPDEAPALPVGRDTTAYAQILTRYVTDDGGFRYAALHGNAEDRALLGAYVTAIGEADPQGWAREEQLAFYINAYNALTVNAVLELWPVTSVMQEDGFFDARTQKVAGADMTLNALENDIIRPRYEEPRIHFAVNCASAGCPWLSNEVYNAADLEAQLERQTQSYLRRTVELNRRRKRASVTKIFEWFEADFAQTGVKEFIATRLEEDDATFLRRRDTRLRHFDYDWALNGRE